ncbi:MAG: ferrochelatase [Nocardioidaceae bacterium]|nr:ferrochelatase [Nocardioidaceae bacterium]
MPATGPLPPYDALLVLSFGGPEEAAHVMPFLENVTRGRGISRERLEEVGQHYFELGGRSPINDQCRALVEAVNSDLAAHGVDVPVYWGNRNWEPYLADTLAQMSRDGIRRAAAFVTSAYSSYSGCRQYRENLYDAVATTAAAPRIDKLRHYFNHPGFVEAFADAGEAALASLGGEQVARLVFVTHSIPTQMAASSGPSGRAYVTQHHSAAELVEAEIARRTGRRHGWDLAYCSRSGPPRVPWLEPDINEHLTTLSRRGTPAVVLLPIGFVSDHVEVLYDLDTEAAATADKLGLGFARAATPGIHPAFVATVRDLLVERSKVESGLVVERSALGALGPAWDVCEAGCCSNPRAARPALCERPA